MGELLAGKIAVVTGAARGIGLAVATRFVAEGARVVIADLDEDAATKAAASFAEGSVVAMRCNVTSESDVEALVNGTVARLGSIDVMVNNAGVTRDATMAKMSLDDFRLVMDVHLVGTWLGTKAAGAAMREQQSGAIVNMSSISGKVGNFGQTNYSAAKAGIVGMTKASAKELARYGVRANVIQPGLIRTAMTEAMPQKAWDAKMTEIPMARAGEPAEVAAVAAFLSSDLSSYMTGTVLEVTGGRYM
ncbi:3-oxoacyl-ACP reductase FabG [Gordonia polyisoprenivorans]|uniref:3-oxoacyl-ACP reductase FabG n=1 Tax=Gordonia polyisoprenivorans TaxID=84595 RepID=UPI001AD75176|nr:3-oxoacyl-ACP reductase FabG [Gordonia polyisoprenivorans]QTI70932.1 3-oxoacyl-ACP reductase FabG [Gordonia polyisoprenivorans]